MKTPIFLIAGLLLAGPVAAAPASGGKPPQACEKQHAQCMKQCDKEKRAWFFKGEAYDTCAAKCEARNESCAATGTQDGDEAKGESVKDEKAKRQRDMNRDRQDDASGSEDEPAARAPANAEGSDSGAAEGQDKEKERGAGGRKNRDKDDAGDDGKASYADTAD